MSDRLQPALWGGLFIGVLSALPLIGFLNCCCCLWVLIGGALAAYVRQQNNPYQIDAAEGAIVGLMAGALGGVVYSILSIPMEMVTGPMMQRWIEGVMSSNPDVTPEMRDILERAASRSAGVAGMLFGLILAVVVFSVFGLLGGLIGVAIFKRNLPPPPPPGTIDIPSSPMVPPPPPPPVQV